MEGSTGKGAAEGDGAALLHQPCRAEAPLVGNQIEGAGAAVFRPPSPVVAVSQVGKDFFPGWRSTFHVVHLLWEWLGSPGRERGG